jgi:polynucleotide 5'-kinase involved in rRNA processing
MGQMNRARTQRTMDNTPRTFPIVKDISISPEWKAAAEMISRQAGIVLVIGVPGSGKSTLSRYLVYYLTHGHRTVALIDCDVGQTHLGPPTTIGMKLYKEPPDRLDTLQPDYMRFIGAPSPGSRICTGPSGIFGNRIPAHGHHKAQPGVHHTPTGIR